MIRILILFLIWVLPLSCLGQVWRYDGEIEVIADSIEYSILNNYKKNLTIKIYVGTENRPTYTARVKWQKNKIIKVTNRGINSWKRSAIFSNGTHKYESFLLVKDGQICQLKKDQTTIIWCPQETKMKWEYSSELKRQTENTKFEYDSKNRISRIIEYPDNIEDRIIYQIIY